MYAVTLVGAHQCSDAGPEAVSVQCAVSSLPGAPIEIGLNLFIKLTPSLLRPARAFCGQRGPFTTRQRSTVLQLKTRRRCAPLSAPEVKQKCRVA